jgi:hypothetical protein
MERQGQDPMAPRTLSAAEVEQIALKVFREEIRSAKLVSEDGIRLIAEEVFERRITPTAADIQAIQARLAEFAAQISQMGGRVRDTQTMLHQLHSFGKGGQPGFFEVRAAQDDKRWDKLDSRLDQIVEADHRRGIVDEAKKIIQEQKDKRYERLSTWLRWGLPLLAGVAWASIWRLLQNLARLGHLHW